jgi:hypothetical protein
MYHIKRLFLPVLLIFVLLSSGNVSLAQESGLITRVSTGMSDTGGGFFTSISGDGRYIVYDTLFDITAYSTFIIYDTQTMTHTSPVMGIGGAFPNSVSYFPVISADGRYVSFISYASNLVPNDTNGFEDIFVYDRQTAITTRVSVDSAGNQANGASLLWQDISADGRYVAFSSEASNLVANDTNGVTDIFVHDRQTGITTRESVDSAENQISVAISGVDISGNGRYITFSSESPNLVANDTNGAWDTFVRDLQTGTTIRVSEGLGGIQGNAGSGGGSLSYDGRYITFSSEATNLIAGDTNGFSDIFKRDLQTGVVTLVSKDSIGTQGDNNSYTPVISSDGRYITFTSIADNLVANDTFIFGDELFRHDTQTGTTIKLSVDTTGTVEFNVLWYHGLSDNGRYSVFATQYPLTPNDNNIDYDIFVRDAQNSTTTLVSPFVGLAPVNVDTDGGSYDPSVSDDGRFVAFLSEATDLVPNDTNFMTDAFVYDRFLGITTRVSVATGNVQANNSTSEVVISGDGRYVAFTSDATNLVAGDSNGVSDVFVYDRQTAQTTRVSLANGVGQANNQSSQPSISSTGRFVAFTSLATNLVTGDTNGVSDVFVRDRTVSETTRKSVTTAGLQSNNASDQPFISDNAQIVAFRSYATNLVTGDTNGVADVFVRDHAASTTARVSLTNGGAQSNGESGQPTLSADGQMVAFSSQATNLVTGDTNGVGDVFVRNRSAGTTIRASVNSSNQQANNESYKPVISGDGGSVVFISPANNLSPADTDTAYDIFVRNILANTTKLAATRSPFDPMYYDNSFVDINMDGNVIVFDVYGEGHSLSDENDLPDIYAQDIVLPPQLSAPNLTAPANMVTTSNPSMSFSWSAVGGATQYQIQIANDSDFIDIVRNHTLATTSYAYSLPVTGTYYWRVRAVNQRYGLWSTSRQFTLQPLPAPTLIAPNNSATLTSLSVDFSWNTVTDATQYQIQIATSSGFTTIVHDHTLTTTSYTYVLSGSGTYHWRVRAKLGGTGGDWSSVRQFTLNIPLPPTSAPTLSSPANNAMLVNSNMTFRWGTVSGATQYQIQISTVNTFVSTVHDHTLTSTNYAYTMVSNGTYYWRVRAKNGGGDGPWSTIYQFNLEIMSAPTLVAPANALTTTTPNITFSWNTVGAATQYDIQIALNNTFTPAMHIHTLSATSYPYVFANAGTYYWRVRGKNGSGNGQWSVIRELTLESTFVPNLISPDDNFSSYDDTFTFTWSAVSGASGYEIQFATDEYFNTIVIQQPATTTSHTQIFGAYEKYYWRVRAVNELWSTARAVYFTHVPLAYGTTTLLFDFDDISHRYNSIFRDNRQSAFVDGYEYNLSTHTKTDLLIDEELMALGAEYVFIRKITPNGRYVLVEVTGTINGVYRYDRVAGVALPVSGQIFNTSSVDISDDGNLVIFMAYQLGTSAYHEYFLHNYQTGQTTLITTLDAPMTPMSAVISATNRYVALTYIYENSGGVIYVYLYDIQTQQTTIILRPDNTPVIIPFYYRGYREFFGNDRYLVFTSYDYGATNDFHILIYDIQTGLHERIMLGVAGDPINDTSTLVDISENGRYVLFLGGEGFQLYVRDRQMGTTTHVSVTPNGDPAYDTGGYNFYATISEDGRYAMFYATLDYYGNTYQEGIYIYALGGLATPTILSSAVISDELMNEFSWTSVASATSYQIQIATDSNFNNVIYSANVTTTNYTHTLELGNYYWRVRAKNANGNSPWSTVKPLTIGLGTDYVINEQQLFNSAQPNLTDGMTFALFDITPTGIMTTLQFDDGAIVTATVKLTAVNGLLQITVEGLSGGAASQQQIFNDRVPALIMNAFDEVIPDDYLTIESAPMTNRVIGFVLVMSED